MTHIFKRIIILAAAFVASALCGARLSAASYTRTVSSGTHTVEIISANDGTKFKVVQDGTELTSVYDDLGAISVSGGQLTFTINTSNLIWMSNMFSVTGSGSLTIVQDSSITGNSVFKRKEGNTTQLVNVDGSSANLTITGNEDESRIVFHGNGKFLMPSGEPTNTFSDGHKCYFDATLTGDEDGNVVSERPILAALQGNISLKYMNLINQYNSNPGTDGLVYSAGAIGCSTGTSLITIKMNHCDISYCYARYAGPAFTYNNINKDSSIALDYCVISNCYDYARPDLSTSAGGGIIRCTGAAYCSLSFKNCDIHHNIENNSAILYFNNPISIKQNELISCLVHDNIVCSGSPISITSHAKLQGCKIYKNKAYNSSCGGIQISAYNFSKRPELLPYDLIVDFDNNSLVYENEAENGVGGMKISMKGETGTGTIFINKEDGTPISQIININGAQVYSNTSKTGVAGISILKDSNTPEEYITEVNILSGTIRNNTTETGNGGGFAISGTLPVTIGQPGKNLYIYDNEAKSGGGFYISDGAEVTINNCEAGSETEPNKATDGNGGAIYVKGGDVTINGGNFKYNEAKGTGSKGKGGSFYVEGGSFTFNDGAISSNTAQNEGGGFYVSGGNVKIFGGNIEGNNAKNGAGAYVTGGSLSVIDDTEHGTHTAKTISGNIATGNGGGFYVNGGDVTLSNASISTNHAASGAGLYSNGGSVEFTSGEVGSNIASGNGGGLFVNGGSIEFSANLDGNTAANGGGLYLASGAEMTFAGGVISKNKAVASESATATTAYHGGSGIQGCGGGIYLQSGPDATHKTTLLFDFPAGMKTFGLYSNEADKAGAEIVAEGGNTEVQLPAISEMQLAGFEGQDASPYWYQDYFTGDTGFYQSGGHAVAGEVTTVDRFKNIMKLIGTQYLEHRIPETRLPEILNNYLCLTMSFSMLNITLKATGLLGHETAMFKLIRHGTDQNTTFDILLRADDGASKTLRNMPWGTYSVIPNNSWNYEYSPVQSKDNIRVGETDHYVIEYNMQHRNSAVMPQHDERQIGGKDVPSSSVSGSVPEKYSGKEL